MDPDSYIAQLGEPRLVVCKQCKYAVWPRNINSHFAGTDHKLSKPIRDAIVARVEEWDQLIEYSNELEIPHSVDKAFDLLHVYNDGLLCNFDTERCQYICRSTDVMRRHLRKSHQTARFHQLGRPNSTQQEGQKNKAELWKKVTCQRFFPNREKSAYFEVKSITRQRPNTTDRVVPVWDQVIMQLNQKRETMQSNAMHVVLKNDAKDANPWLERTGWSQYLAGIERDKLLECIETPDEETEPQLHVIWEAMDEMVLLCQETVDVRAGSFIRFEIMRTDIQNRFQPLRGYMEAKEVVTRAKPWKQIVMFIGRTWKQREWKAPKYKLKSHQRKAWKNLMSAVQQNMKKTKANNEIRESEQSEEKDEEEETSEGEENEEKEATSPVQKVIRLNPVAQKCMKFCLSLLYETIDNNEYDSTLICALAVLGITRTGWKGFDQYPSMLSAIIKVSRFMVVHDTWETTQHYPKNKEFNSENSNQSLSDSDELSANFEQQSWLKLIKNTVNHYMIRGSLSPMQWMLDLRAYGMSIAFNTTTQGAIDWVGDEIVYKNIRFTMNQLREMIRSTIEIATYQLFHDLMFINDEKNIPIIPWTSLRDDPTNLERQWNFTNSENNHWPVNGKTWLQDRIQSDAAVQSEFVKDQFPLEWKRSGIESYMRKVVEWRGLLLVLVHMTGGQPARSSEILSVHHSNTVKGLMRNVFIEKGLIVMVSRYHKGYRASGSEKIIHRYLPRAVGKLYVYYDWLVRPFQETLEAVIWQKDSVSTLVWPPDPKGTKWTGTRMTNAMQKASRRGMGVVIGVQAWRHMVISISRRFLRKDHAFNVDEEDFEESDEDGDVIYDQQAAHTSHVAGIAYGRGLMQLNGVIEKEQARFRRASVEWHTFLGLTEEKSQVGLKRGRSDINDSRFANAKRTKRLCHLNIEEKLHEMLGNHARFRDCQQEAIQAILRGENFIVIVMGTGQGKSLTFMMPAWNSSGGVSVVIVPLITLRQDMIDRCRRLKIPCAEWNQHPNPMNPVRLMFVTPESAVSEGFQTWLNRQKAAGQLDRIFIDECHVILNDQEDFRPKLAQMGVLNQVGVQMIMLTATLPPTMEKELWKRMWWSQAKVRLFRARTSRPNIKYSTKHVQGPPGKFQQWAQVIQQAASQHVNGKVVIYCQSVASTLKLAEELGCDGYHHHAPDKNQMLDRFRQDGSVIVTTSAFGMGIDVSNIRIVFHIDRPRNMLDYAQESGRAGRDGLPSEAIVLMSKTKDKRLEEIEPQTVMVDLFVQNQVCKRQILDDYLDGYKRTQCEAGEEMCGFCEQAFESHPEPNQTQMKVESDQDESENESSIPELLQEQQQERDQIIDGHRLKMQQEGQEEKELREYLEYAQGTCSVCRWVKGVKERHVLYHCPEAKAQIYKTRYKQLQSLIRSRRMMARYSGCMNCYAPQAWCEAWEEQETERGQENRGSWRRVGGRDWRCQFDELLLSEYVVALGQEEQIVQKRNERMREQNCDPQKEHDEGRFLGRKVIWSGLETNGLVQELKEIAKYWE